ncbi:MAG: glycosyltransferase family 4 protein [Alphaproteobacteria bacterium]|nr:glycosyltransferase family 4 protein [Alphaproteobacteria bacterium]
MRIVAIYHALSLGGVQRILVDHTRCWAEENHAVTVITENDESQDAYRLHPDINRIVLGWSGPKRGPIRIIRAILALRREIVRQRPDVVVGFGGIYALFVVLATLGLSCRRIGCEFGDPTRNRLRSIGEFLRRRSYRYLDAVTGETDAVRDWLKHNTSARRAVTIPKSVQWPLLPTGPGPAPDHFVEPLRKIIIAAGRLSPEKQFDALIAAFATIAAARPGWIAVILGEGPCRPALEAQIEAFGLKTRVLLPGQASDMATWYRRASLVAVTSATEGGPNVLIEGLAHGVPAISFDCDYGPRTIIRDGLDGALVPPGDVAALARTMAQLMDDDALRARMSARPPEARERFSEENLMGHWNALFREIGLAGATK